MTRPLTVGSICTGYGGLERALDMAGVPHTLEWVSEIAEPACQVLTERFLTVPNIGDINHAKLTEVDLITAGFPCIDISTAGRRAGLDGEHSGLWWRIADVIGDLRPRFVLLENVAAISSLGGTAVVGSLTGLGYDCRWVTVRASDFGACHQRARWFCLAASDSPSDAGFVIDRERRETVADAVGGGWPLRDPVAIGNPNGRLEDQVALLSTPTSWLGRRPSHSELGTPNSMSGTGRELVRDISRLLPTPTSRDYKDGGFCPNVETNGLLGRVAWKFLPTPTASQPGGTAEQQIERKKRGKMNRDNPTVTDVGLLVEQPGFEFGEYSEAVEQPGFEFGEYSEAVERHARLMGTPAPDPTRDGRLNPVFVEWMMGLPAGWVTDIVEKRSAALRTLGNGVVPQQAAAALQVLTS